MDVNCGSRNVRCSVQSWNSLAFKWLIFCSDQLWKDVIKCTESLKMHFLCPKLKCVRNTCFCDMTSTLNNTCIKETSVLAGPKKMRGWNKLITVETGSQLFCLRYLFTMVRSADYGQHKFNIVLFLGIRVGCITTGFYVSRVIYIWRSENQLVF